MPGRIRMRDAGGTLRTISRIRMRDADGNLRTIQRVRVRDATGVLRTVFGILEASVSPTTLSETGTTSFIETASTTTVTPVGGTPSYTFLWAAAPYNTDAVAPSTPTSPVTKFRRNSCVSGDIYLGDFYCTVTDATGVQAVTEMVNVTIERT